MNVLYLGPIYAANDHGHASRSIIRQLVGQCNLTTRPIILYPENIQTDEFIKYENQQDHFDIIIQDAPAYRLDYEGGCKNIAIVRQPTRYTYYSTIFSRLNMMDELWCVNEHDKQNIEGSLSHKPIKVFPIKYDAPNNEDPQLEISNPGNNFIFGWVGEPLDIDNLEAFLIAFYTEFEPNEPVTVVINVRNAQKALEKIGNVKQKLRLFADINRYTKETITTLPFQHLWRLEPAIDCLVRTTRGETYNKFTHDFYLTGKPTIIPHWGSTLGPNAVGSVARFDVSVDEVPCICSDSPLNDMFTARERWWDIHIGELMNQMREIYESRPKLQIDLEVLNQNIPDIQL